MKKTTEVTSLEEISKLLDGLFGKADFTIEAGGKCYIIKIQSYNAKWNENPCGFRVWECCGCEYALHESVFCVDINYVKKLRGNKRLKYIFYAIIGWWDENAANYTITDYDILTTHN